MQSNASLGISFQSTPSVGRATAIGACVCSSFTISIHALRGEGDLFGGSGSTLIACISIHALRGEGDDFLFFARVHFGISIHALRGEGDFTH